MDGFISAPSVRFPHHQITHSATSEKLGTEATTIYLHAYKYMHFRVILKSGGYIQTCTEA
jgi:hypothetical protein